MWNNNFSFFYLWIFLFFISILFVNNFIAIPFKTINLQYDEVSKDFFYKIYTNKLHINITLGTPKQTSILLLSMEKELFYIHKDGFYHNESSTYKNLDKDSKAIITESENKSEDIFYFEFYNSYNELSNKNNINRKKVYKSFQINFILMNYIIIWNSNNNKNPGEIGLQYRNINSSDSILFVKSLHESREIKNYIFSFIFTNNTNININTNNIFNHNGYFIIGEELTDNENEKDKIKYGKAVDRSGLIKWDLFFDEIYSYSNSNMSEYNKKIINKNHKVQLIIDKPYIIGTEEYESFIISNFFQDLINKNICFKKILSANTDIYSYYCDNSSELFINSKFPDLYIFSRELGETFILNKKDLFYYDNNYNNKDEYFSYFMIWFTKSNYAYGKNSWCLGVPFFKKYRFSFDYEKKMIGFYNQSFYFNPNEQEQNNPEIINNKNVNILKIIFICALIIMIVIFVVIFIKIFTNKKKRKKKLNELVDEENYDYNNYNKEYNTDKNNIN